jgi:tetratricopeptide (TPR) repeat protein
LSTVELHARLQQTREAEQAIAEARRVAPATRRLQVFLEHCEARVLEARGDLPRARELYSQAIQMARRANQTDLALEALARWSRLASMTTERLEVEHLIDDGIREARDSGRMDIVFNLMSLRARNYTESGRADLAMAEINKLRVEAESLGYLSQLVYALSGLGALAVELSRWEEAASYSRQAAELAERLGNELILGHTLAIQCQSELRQQLLPEARAHGERAVSVLSQLPRSDSLPIAHAYLAEVYSGLGEAPLARSHYQQALDLFDALGMSWWRERVISELGPKLATSVKTS